MVRAAYPFVKADSDGDKHDQRTGPRRRTAAASPGHPFAPWCPGAFGCNRNDRDAFDPVAAVGHQKRPDRRGVFVLRPVGDGAVLGPQPEVRAGIDMRGQQRDARRIVVGVRQLVAEDVHRRVVAKGLLRVRGRAQDESLSDADINELVRWANAQRRDPE